MIRDAIAALAAGRRPTRAEARDVMREIMEGAATPAQIAAYLIALRIRGEDADVIAGSAEAMRERFTAIRAPAGPVVDTCGTGGDGARTFNISTTAAFVAAGAGAIVAKHGNRGVSSTCGSADVLAELGVDLQLPPPRVEACLAEVGIAFLFAPLLHPAMKHAIGPRREIGIRTVFNLLGPLSNPAGARRGVLGVYDPAMVPVLAGAARDLGAERVLVVHGSDGLDELTLTGPSRVAEATPDGVRQFEVTPEDAGLPRCDPAELAGGDPPANARLLRGVLEGDRGPRRDIVLLNAAAALLAADLASDLREAVARAAESVDSGAARRRLDALVDFCRRERGVPS